MKVYNRYDEAKNAVQSFFETNTTKTKNHPKPLDLAVKSASKGHYELLKESEFSSILGIKQLKGLKS